MLSMVTMMNSLVLQGPQICSLLHFLKVHLLVLKLIQMAGGLLLVDISASILLGTLEGGARGHGMIHGVTCPAPKLTLVLVHGCEALCE